MSKSQIPRGAPGRIAGMKPAEAGSVKPGQVVFFPACRKSTRPNSQTMIFKGNGFGVFMGVVPQGMGEPTKEMLPPLLAGIGWVSFEDVFELLGEEQFKLLETKFREKYEIAAGDEAAKPAEAPKIALPPERKLVTPDGSPLLKAAPEAPDGGGH